MKLLISLSLLVVLCVPSTTLALDFTAGVKDAKNPEFKKLDAPQETEFKKLNTVHGNIRDYFPNLDIISAQSMNEIRVVDLSEAIKTPEIDSIEESKSAINLTDLIHSDYVEVREILESKTKSECSHLFGNYGIVYFGVSNFEYKVEISKTHTTSVSTADLYCAIPLSKKVVDINGPLETKKSIRTLPFPDININSYPYYYPYSYPLRYLEVDPYPQ